MIDQASATPEPLSSDELICNLLSIARRNAEIAQLQRLPLDPETWKIPHIHYNAVATGEPLHVGVREILAEAELAQQLLDLCGISDGLPQGSGDVDWRVAVAVTELIDARGRLSRIVFNHAQERGDGGTVGLYCVECSHTWPCPTYRFANGDSDYLDPWDDD